MRVCALKILYSAEFLLKHVEGKGNGLVMSKPDLRLMFLLVTLRRDFIFW